jgi:hypothetical protein
MSREEAARLAAGDLRSERPPKLVVDRLEDLYDQIEKPAHRWLKGMMAAALALDDERRQLRPRAARRGKPSPRRDLRGAVVRPTPVARGAAEEKTSVAVGGCCWKSREEGSTVGSDERVA